jgi:uncharacterized surface protein with fasciclin (FAS1) repeats
MRTTIATGWLVVTCLIAAGCGDDSIADDGPNEDGIDEVAEDVDLPDTDAAQDAQQSLVDALDQLELGSLSSAVASVDVGELTDAPEFTFLAPSDEAFAELSTDDLADLLADTDRLGEVLRTHLIPERLDAAALTERESVTAESGVTLTIEVEGDTVMVGEATVLTSDVEAGDGVVHVVDRFLIEDR